MSDDIDAVVEEIVVDAYGEDEQLWAFHQFFEGEATFPFPAEVVGSPVEVVGVDYEGDERRGLVARCRRNGQGYTVALIDVAPGRLTERTAALIAAYRRWSGVETGPDRR
ncbi:MAG: calcium-binding protein [Acidimicrobiales bacterium]